jgi:hypothetical protein
MGVRSWLLGGPTRELLRRTLGERWQNGLDWLLVSDTQNLRRERQRQALESSVKFIERELPEAPSFSRPLHLLSHALGQVRVEGEGLYLEFGVYRGTTIDWLAARTSHVVHGFDSFEGLPDRWREGFERGRFKTGGLPSVRKNVRLVPGWFDQTLPGFVTEHREPVAFLHVDCDLYSSTRTIFSFLGERLVPGSVIVFDEFFNYPGWEDGEARAFRETVKALALEFEYLGYCHLGQQVAVRVLRNPARG